jgi:hypothetical protein
MPKGEIQAELWTHPASGSMALTTITAAIERRSRTNLHIRYESFGTVGDLILPGPAPSLRADNLWQTTCFELFLRGIDRTGYREFNFSPSGQWAAYEFRGYRDGMTQAALPGPPIIETLVEANRLIVDVRLSLHLPDDRYSVGLAAVIEERRLEKSYWAAGHAGAVPDFHHPACFVLELPPPSAA